MSSQKPSRWRSSKHVWMSETSLSCLPFVVKSVLTTSDAKSADLRQNPLSALEVRDERPHRLLARRIVRRPEDRGRVDRRDRRHAQRRVQPLAAVLGDAEGRPEHRLRRGGAHQDDQVRPHRLQLGVEPRPAGADLLAVRLLMEAALATLYPAEVLDRVGDVDAVARDAGGLEAFAAPWPNMVCVAFCHRLQPRQASAASWSDSSDSCFFINDTAPTERKR